MTEVIVDKWSAAGVAIPPGFVPVLKGAGVGVVRKALSCRDAIAVRWSRLSYEFPPDADAGPVVGYLVPGREMVSQWPRRGQHVVEFAGRCHVIPTPKTVAAQRRRADRAEFQRIDDQTRPYVGRATRVCYEYVYGRWEAIPGAVCTIPIDSETGDDAWLAELAAS